MWVNLRVDIKEMGRWLPFKIFLIPFNTYHKKSPP